MLCWPGACDRLPPEKGSKTSVQLSRLPNQRRSNTPQKQRWLLLHGWGCEDAAGESEVKEYFVTALSLGETVAHGTVFWPVRDCKSHFMVEVSCRHWHIKSCRPGRELLPEYMKFACDGFELDAMDCSTRCGTALLFAPWAMGTCRF